MTRRKARPTTASVDDEELAQKIVHLVAQHADGRVLGSLQLVRGCGLPIARTQLARSRRRVQQVMGRAIELSLELYPGQVLTVDRSGTWGTYRMITDVDADTLAVEMARMGQARSKIARVEKVTSVAKQGPGLMLHGVASGMSQMFAVVDQINALAERPVESASTP